MAKPFIFVFITAIGSVNIEPTNFVSSIRESFATLHALQVSRYSVPKVFVSKDLNVCSHVVLRVTFSLPSGEPRSFALDLNSRKDNVLIDGLKLAKCASDYRCPKKSVTRINAVNIIIPAETFLDNLFLK